MLMQKLLTILMLLVLSGSVYALENPDTLVPCSDALSNPVHPNCAPGTACVKYAAIVNNDILNCRDRADCQTKYPNNWKMYCDVIPIAGIQCNDNSGEPTNNCPQNTKCEAYAGWIDGKVQVCANKNDCQTKYPGAWGIWCKSDSTTNSQSGNAQLPKPAYLFVTGVSSPTTDVSLIQELARTFGPSLGQGNYAIKLASEITQLDLNNRVTVVIDHNKAIIIIGANSPTEQVVKAEEIKNYLKNKGIPVETKLHTQVNTNDIIGSITTSTPTPSTAKVLDQGVIHGHVEYKTDFLSCDDTKGSIVDGQRNDPYFGKVKMEALDRCYDGVLTDWQCQKTDVKDPITGKVTPGAIGFSWKEIQCPCGCAQATQIGEGSRTGGYLSQGCAPCGAAGKPGTPVTPSTPKAGTDPSSGGECNPSVDKYSQCNDGVVYTCQGNSWVKQYACQAGQSCNGQGGCSQTQSPASGSGTDSQGSGQGSGTAIGSGSNPQGSSGSGSPNQPSSGSPCDGLSGLARIGCLISKPSQWFG